MNPNGRHAIPRILPHRVCCWPRWRPSAKRPAGRIHSLYMGSGCALILRVLNTGPFMILLRLSPLFLFSACEPEIPEDATMLAMGDSYFDYHEGSDIPDVAAARSGHVVYNAAISGAQLSSEEYAIRTQTRVSWSILFRTPFSRAHLWSSWRTPSLRMGRNMALMNAGTSCTSRAVG